jgi:hypothetical protein
MRHRRVNECETGRAATCATLEADDAADNQCGPYAPKDDKFLLPHTTRALSQKAAPPCTVIAPRAFPHSPEAISHRCCKDPNYFVQGLCHARAAAAPSWFRDSLGQRCLGRQVPEALPLA